jgi:hypothetical protein
MGSGKFLLYLQGMLSSSLPVSDSISTIAAMRQQEENCYLKCDVLEENSVSNIDIDKDCRNKMANWCYQVIDLCEMSREMVDIALSYLGRHPMTDEGVLALRDRSVFQLACMAALYTAIKLHEPRVLDSKIVARFSKGEYSPKQVESMESILLEALQWPMNPSMALALVRQFLALVPNEVMDEQAKEAAYDLTKLQTEMAVVVYEFVSVKASNLAFCS